MIARSELSSRLGEAPVTFHADLPTSLILQSCREVVKEVVQLGHNIPSQGTKRRINDFLSAASYSTEQLIPTEILDQLLSTKPLPTFKQQLRTAREVSGILQKEYGRIDKLEELDRLVLQLALVRIGSRRSLALDRDVDTSVASIVEWLREQQKPTSD